MANRVKVYRSIETGEMFVRVGGERFMLAEEWFSTEGGMAVFSDEDEMEFMKSFAWSELDQAEKYIYSDY